MFQVKTDDGYILSLQRIPEGRTGGGGGGLNKPPVLLQHGVLVVSISFVIVYAYAYQLQISCETYIKKTDEFRVRVFASLIKVSQYHNFSGRQNY